jgi:predicted metal-dependent peptidase
MSENMEPISPSEAAQLRTVDGLVGRFYRDVRHHRLEQVLASAKRDLPKSVHHKLPELLQRGDLDLSGVLQSFFAFK